MGSGATFPVASTSTTPATFFMVADTAATSEIVLVTAATTTSPWVWNVTRGAENTTPVTHATGFTVQQVVSAGALQNFKQASNADIISVTVSSSLTTVCTYQPIPSDYATGSLFEAVAYGPFQKLGSARTIDMAWSVYYGSTLLASCAPHTSGNEFLTTLAAGSSFDINATVVFQSVGTSTTATANINMFWGGSGTNATTGSGQICTSSSAPTTLSGTGPLALTAQWSSSATNFQATVLTSVFYRAA